MGSGVLLIDVAGSKKNGLLLLSVLLLDGWHRGLGRQRSGNYSTHPRSQDMQGGFEATARVTLQRVELSKHVSVGAWTNR